MNRVGAPYVRPRHRGSSGIDLAIPGRDPSRRGQQPRTASLYCRRVTTDSNLRSISSRCSPRSTQKSHTRSSRVCTRRRSRTSSGATSHACRARESGPLRIRVVGRRSARTAAVGALPGIQHLLVYPWRRARAPCRPAASSIAAWARSDWSASSSRHSSSPYARSPRPPRPRLSPDADLLHELHTLHDRLAALERLVVDVEPVLDGMAVRVPTSRSATRLGSPPRVRRHVPRDPRRHAGGIRGAGRSFHRCTRPALDIGSGRGDSSSCWESGASRRGASTPPGARPLLHEPWARREEPRRAHRPARRGQPLAGRGDPDPSRRASRTAELFELVLLAAEKLEHGGTLLLEIPNAVSLYTHSHALGSTRPTSSRSIPCTSSSWCDRLGSPRSIAS